MPVNNIINETRSFKHFTKYSPYVYYLGKSFIVKIYAYYIEFLNVQLPNSKINF